MPPVRKNTPKAGKTDLQKTGVSVTKPTTNPTGRRPVPKRAIDHLSSEIDILESSQPIRRGRKRTERSQSLTEAIKEEASKPKTPRQEIEEQDVNEIGYESADTQMRSSSYHGSDNE